MTPDPIEEFTRALHEEMQAELDAQKQRRAQLPMALDAAKMELVRFLKGLSDEQLSMLERIMVPRNGRSNEEYLSVVTQIGGMVAYEQCMRSIKTELEGVDLG